MNQWYCTWAYKSLDMGAFPLYMKDQIQVFRCVSTLNGDSIRIRFSNCYSEHSLKIESISLQIAGGKAYPITLDGNDRITIEPFSSFESDELPVSVSAGDEIRVTAAFGDCMTDTACTFLQNPFCSVAHFDASGKLKLPASVFFDRNPLHHCVVGFDRIRVKSKQQVKTIAAFGDSITHMSRWTAPLAMRLLKEYPGQFSFVNFGICGNRILHDASRLSGNGHWFGTAGIRRFASDLFSEDVHADVVLLLEGVNDLLHPRIGAAPLGECVSPNEIAQGLRDMAGIAHKEGAKVWIGTLLPFNGCKQHWKPEREAERLWINEWIRSADDFDYLLDWDMCTRWTEDTTRLDPSGGSEDNLHPGIAGGIAMANIVNLADLIDIPASK